MLPDEKREKITDGLLLLVSALVSYLPVWNARFIWDDNAITQNPQLRTLGGLWEIWFHPTRSAFEEHYWPVTYTVLWFGQQLWGNAPLGYHFLNLALHSANGIILYWIVRQFCSRKTAFLAGILFLVHPIHVESVAWAIELKDVLSGFFYLLSFYFYTRWAKTRERLCYAIALACFVLGLGSKSVVITLPVALLIWHWWSEETHWKSICKALLPFLLVAVAFAALDLYVVSLQQLSEFKLSVAARALIVGRAFWFYILKLVVPWPLVPLYKQWEINAGQAWQYLFPLLTLVFFGGLWLFRRQIGRTVPSLLLFYLVTLSPMLGSIPFSFMKHSYVADRYQYLASAGPLILISAGLMRLRNRKLQFLSSSFLALILMVLTMRQSSVYRDLFSFFGHTINHNPRSWAAHYGLGEAYISVHKPELVPLAVERFKSAVEIQPWHIDGYVKLASAQASAGDMQGATRTLKLAARLERNNVAIMYATAMLMAKQGDKTGAAAKLREILASNPSWEPAKRALQSIAPSGFSGFQ